VTTAALAPEVRALLEAGTSPPAQGELTMAELREASRQQFDAVCAALPYEDMAAVRDHEVAVDGGSITARVYTPHGGGPLPAFVYLHGGGYFVGSIDWRFHVAKAREIASRVGCAVVAVEYRLAPEFRFPIAAEDCYAAFLWTAANAEKLGVDAARIAVGGESAGGTLAAVVCLMARDRNGPRPIFQLLEMPAADLADVRALPSARAFGRGYGLELEALDMVAEMYLADPADAYHPYASPVRAADLSDLPPAHVMTAELDPIRDSGEEYGRRLQAAGVPATVARQDGHIHGSCALYASWPPARAWLDEVLTVLAAAFSTGASASS
jgi:acetyl esterase